MSVADDLSPCKPAELAALIAQLDAEFVFGRGRRISLAQRYPALLSIANLDNIFVLRAQGRITASIAVKTFRWNAAEDHYTGAMIGMVWTDPARRGSGLASGLLAHVGETLRDSADFAVLWTAQPAFYARSGWQSSDCASFGTIAGTGGGAAGGVPADFAKVRAIWHQQESRVERDSVWHFPLPLPAESLEMFEAAGAYAVAGRRGDDLYCYEIAGEVSSLAALLEDMRAACGTLYINERTGSPAQLGLARMGVAWEPKPLAMWLGLGNTSIIPSVRDRYIPWLDRV